MDRTGVAFTTTPHTGVFSGDLGAQFDAAVLSVVASDAAIAAVEAQRARQVARVAALADRMAREDGTAATTEGREWARRRVAVELACATRRSERATIRLIDDSERLVDDLPATLHSLESGTISYAHARALISHAITVPQTFRAAFEREALPEAHVLTAHRFEDRVRKLRERLHPDSIIERTRTAKDERYVSLSKECDGMTTIFHYLPAIDAVAIDDLLDRTARASRSDTDDRTHAQRRCDALTDFILGRATGPRLTPTVLITMPATVLEGDDSKPAVLHGYGPIDPVTAREIAATASTFLRATPSQAGGETVITRHRTRAGRPLLSAELENLTPALAEATTSGTPDRYSASPIVRTALALLDETCRFPGCGRRADRCELDHTTAWAEGGRTIPDNLAHLCTRHHHLKHEGGWKVTPSQDGTRTLTWTSPRGTTYTTTPENRSLTSDDPDPPPA